MCQTGGEPSSQTQVVLASQILKIDGHEGALDVAWIDEKRTPNPTGNGLYDLIRTGFTDCRNLRERNGHFYVI